MSSHRSNSLLWHPLCIRATAGFVGISWGLALATGCVDRYELSLGAERAADAGVCARSECRDAGRACERDGGSCRQCRGDDDCGHAEVCDPATRACTSTCRVNGDCSGSQRALCQPETLRCVECILNADCQERRAPHCDSNSYTCEPCVSNADCDDDQVCDSDWRRCVEPCTGRNDCRDDHRPLCDRKRSVCVECVDDGDCRGDCVRGECRG